MIDKNILIDMARIHRIRPYQEEKRYIQTLLLSSLFYRVSTGVVFRGGTASFFFYSLNRFSEDLDFTVESEVDVDSIANGCVEDLELFGIQSNLKSLHENSRSISYRISCQGPLFTTEVSRNTVKLEFSMREAVLKIPDFSALSPDFQEIIPFSCLVMNAIEMQSEKIRAILTRNKARDLYDLWHLFRNSRGELCNTGMIDTKLGWYSRKFSPTEFDIAVESKRMNWISELQPVAIGVLPDFDMVAEEVKEFMRQIWES